MIRRWYPVIIIVLALILAYVMVFDTYVDILKDEEIRRLEEIIEGFGNVK